MKKKPIKPAKEAQRRTHSPEDIAEIVETFGCTERHARRVLSEGGKEYAMEMRQLQAEKLRLQILRIQLWLDDVEDKYIHVDEYSRQNKIVMDAIRTALNNLIKRLCRELPGRTAREMGALIQAASNDARREMCELCHDHARP
jgi:hypothetical protein